MLMSDLVQPLLPLSQDSAQLRRKLQAVHDEYQKKQLRLVRQLTTTTTNSSSLQGNYACKVLSFKSNHFSTNLLNWNNFAPYIFILTDICMPWHGSAFTIFWKKHSITLRDNVDPMVYMVKMGRLLYGRSQVRIQDAPTFNKICGVAMIWNGTDNTVISTLSHLWSIKLQLLVKLGLN